MTDLAKPPAGPPLLELEGVRKTYGERVVLDDVSLTVERHDVVCLIGSSGSGKSTLLRCLDLLEDVDDGVIRLDGREISDPDDPIRQITSCCSTTRSMPRRTTLSP